MPFQSRVNTYLPQAFPGDFCSANPRVSTVGPEGSWYAGASGVLAATFVWGNENTRQVFNSAVGAGLAATVLPDGFVRKGGMGIIASVPEESTMQIPAGQMVTVFDKGEFWVAVPSGVTAARRAEVYADPASGLIVNSGTLGAVKTGYYYALSAAPGEMVKISAWISPSA